MFRSRNTLALTCLLALVLPVVVGQHVSVLRGRQTDLRSSIPTLPLAGAARLCTVRLAIPSHLACGAVIPSTFECNYNGSVLYQHLGCLASRELLSFQVSSLPDDGEGEISVEFFSVEIGVVDDSASNLRLIQVGVRRQADVFFVRVRFPSPMVGRCSYELLSNHSLLPLPLAGRLTGEVNRPLPCGVVSRAGVKYIALTQREVDYVLLRVKTRTGSPIYVVASLHISDSSPRPVAELFQTGLLVTQSLRTPIVASLFLGGFTPVLGEEYKFTFPVLPGGAFLPVHGNATAVGSSTFTLADLRDGLVSFQPAESHDTILANYLYLVADVAGAAVASGVVRVEILTRDWNRPSQRRNRGLAVARGSSVQLGSSMLDFYILGECWLRLARPPLHGSFILHGSIYVGETLLSRDLLSNGSIAYNHSGDKAMTDGSTWSILCRSVSLAVFLGVRITPVGNGIVSPLLTALTASPHFGVPLSATALMTPPSMAVQFTTEFGFLVQIQNRDLLNIPFFPLVPVSVLHSHGKPVSNASFSDIQEDYIWYVPPLNRTTDSLSLSSGPGSAILSVLVSIDETGPSIIADSHQISTVEEIYPRILHNFPLPLHHHLPLYITPAFLSVHVGPFSLRSVLFEIITTPLYGRLCHIQHACNDSLAQFTQEDINLQHIVYVPTTSKPLRNDTIFFFVSVEGMRSYTPHLHQLDVVAHPRSTLPPPTNQFWLSRGRSKIISAKYLRHFVQWFATKNLTFLITSPPRHGVVLCSSSGKSPCSDFTFDDARNRRVSYQHDRASKPHCSDSIGFTVKSSKSSSIQSSLMVIVKQSNGSTFVTVQPTPKKLEGASGFIFSSRDVDVLSSFCPEFIIFTIDWKPLQGVLSLYMQESGSVVQLAENSSFSAQDILLGRLQYSLVHQEQNTSDIFNFSVNYPSSTIQLEGPPTRTGPSPFVYEVFITTLEPGVVHNVSVILNTPRPLSLLTEADVYGYVLGPSDIVVLSDSEVLQPSKVMVDIAQPVYGSITLNRTQTSYFSLSDLHRGWVRYESPLRVRRYGNSDVFNVSIIVFLGDRSVHAVHSQPFTIVWNTVQLTQQNYVVGEVDRSALITLRRDGPLWLTSEVTLITLPVNATPSDSCTADGGDYCPMAVRVMFGLGQSTANVSVVIFDDDEAEGPETFRVMLTTPINATLPRSRLSTALVTIMDAVDDYAVLAFEAPEATLDPLHCRREVWVNEGVGTLQLNISRHGNLDHNVSVICYTQVMFSRDPDFVPRPNSAASTVTFNASQSSAVCDVQVLDDGNNESREQFRVFLGTTEGLARVDAKSSPLCVFISHDANDAPMVVFNVSEVVVRESQENKVHAKFVIIRRGSDLSFPTTVSFRALSLPSDTATPGLDYAPFSGVCGVGAECVTFRSGDTTIVRTVTIFPDRTREGNETLHVNITDVIGGWRGRPGLLRVVIEDGTSLTVVGFTKTEFHFLETDGAITIPMRRSDFIADSTLVRCILKQENATSDAEDMLEGDFAVPDRPERVTFAPNVTDAVCSVHIKDDSRREDTESFTVRLDSTMPGVFIAANASLARVFIHDPEDVSLVQFTKDTYIVREPLSNYRPDRLSAFVSLRRSGDLNQSTMVSYITVDSRSTASVDYIPAYGHVVFAPGQSDAEISIELLANHHKDTSSSFSVVLSLNASLLHGREAQLGAQMRALVIVVNEPVQGVYFPELPLVAALFPNGSLDTGVSLPSDLPLLCITPCDPLYKYVWNRYYLQECKIQTIQPRLTKYSWEVTRIEGESFGFEATDSSFTSTDSKVLESVYLSPGMSVRCVAQAVDSTNLSGNIRTSAPVRILASSHCDAVATMKAALVTYHGFSGEPEDLVRLDVTIPYLSNSVPLVSSLPLIQGPLSLITQPPSRLQHKCSTLADPSQDSGSLLKPLSPSTFFKPRESKSVLLYQHLDLAGCRWTFSTWYSLSELEDDCGAVVGGAVGGVSELNLTIYVLQIHLGSALNVTAQPPPSPLRLPLSSEPLLVTPFVTLPTGPTPEDAVLLPLSVEHNVSSGQLTVYLLTTSGHDRPLTSVSPLSLLHSTNTSDGYNQAWQLVMQMPSLEGVTLHVIFSSKLPPSPRREYTFSLPVSLRPFPTFITAIHTALLHDQNSSLKALAGAEPFGEEEVVYGVVALDPSQRLRSGYRVEVLRVTACPLNYSRSQKSCDNASLLLTILDQSGMRSEFSAALDRSTSEGRATFQFLTSPLYKAPVGANEQWLVHVTSAIVTEDRSRTIEQHDAPLALHLKPLPPTPGTLTGSWPLSPFFYAAIAIFLSAVILVLVGVGVALLLCCSWQARQKRLWLLHSKAGLANNAKAPPTSCSPGETKKPRRLSRTHSTTCFPSAEGVAPPPRGRGPSTPSVAIARPTPPVPARQERSQSLPDLTREENRPSKKQHRRTFTKPLTTVTPARPSRFRRAGLSPVRVIQNDLGRRRRAMPSAYAVLSLAASAQTPEPGSLPATQL